MFHTIFLKRTYEGAPFSLYFNSGLVFLHNLQNVMINAYFSHNFFKKGFFKGIPFLQNPQKLPITIKVNLSHDIFKKYL